MNNGEDKYVNCTGVRYHETTTGWAESSLKDVRTMWKPEWDNQINVSDGVVKDWSDDLVNIVFNGGLATNPVIVQQINLDKVCYQ